MSIGLVNLFPTRPYFHHLIYFRYLLEKKNYKTDTLFCNGGSLSCYYKKQHNTLPWYVVCAQCKLRRYTALSSDVKHTKYKHELNTEFYRQPSTDLEAKFRKICINSYATIHRIEQLEDVTAKYDHQELQNDIEALANVYHYVSEWIKSSDIKKAILFNGRMDLLNAAVLAFEDNNIPYLSYEGSFFGRGIYFFLNSNCLSLNQWEEGAKKYLSKPLTNNQAFKALDILKKRLSRDASLEWRDYFSKESDTGNKKDIVSKALILLSSTNEVYGSGTFVTSWDNYLDGIDKIIKTLNILPHEVIVRGHPVWNAEICGFGGEQIEDIYQSWAINNGYRYYASKTTIDTQLLIQATENVIINFSSALFEAAYYDKFIICTHISNLYYSSLLVMVDSEEKLKDLPARKAEFDNAEEKILRYRNLLRFTYLAAYRLPVFFNEFKPITKLEYEYDINSDIIEEVLKAADTNEYPFADKNYNQTDVDYEISYIDQICNGTPLTEPPFDDEQLTSIDADYKPISFFTKGFIPNAILALEKKLGKGDYSKI